jgi:hypothetical protein
METLLSIAIGVVSSVVSSIVFLLALSSFRPNLEVSPIISRTTDREGNKCYTIKVVNKGSRSVLNVKAKLRLQTSQSVPGGLIVRNRGIELRASEVFEIKKFNKKDFAAEYAHRFLSYEDIDDIWQDENNSYLSFRIYATDSLSNFGKVFGQEYHTKRVSLIDGSFEFGNSMKIP